MTSSRPDAYAVLARFGVTPDSSIAQVLDASFEMSPADHASPAVNEAWESLRTVRQRILIDLFDPTLPPAPPALAPAADTHIPWQLLAELATPDPDAFAAFAALPDEPSLPDELDPLTWIAALDMSAPTPEP